MQVLTLVDPTCRRSTGTDYDVQLYSGVRTAYYNNLADSTGGIPHTLIREA